MKNMTLALEIPLQSAQLVECTLNFEANRGIKIIDIAEGCGHSLVVDTNNAANDLQISFGMTRCIFSQYNTDFPVSTKILGV